MSKADQEVEAKVEKEVKVKVGKKEVKAREVVEMQQAHCKAHSGEDCSGEF